MVDLFHKIKNKSKKEEIKEEIKEDSDLEKFLDVIDNCNETYKNEILKEKICRICSDYAQYKCGICKKVRYCSRNCQKLHWKTHKIVCENEEI